MTPLRSRKRQTPETRLTSDDDDDDGDGGANETDNSFEVRKRARRGESFEPDPDRRIRDVEAFQEKEGEGDGEGGKKALSMVHAEDITSVQKAGRFKSAFKGEAAAGDVLLQYPSAAQKEKYGFSFPLVLFGFWSRHANLVDTIWSAPETITSSGPSTISFRLSTSFPRITSRRTKPTSITMILLGLSAGYDEL